MRATTNIFIASMAFLLMCLCSCTHTVYKPVETVRMQYEGVAKWRIDTVVDRDTVVLVDKGDTIFSQIVKWRWRVKETHDTVYVERVDSVPVFCPVERQFSRWERTKQDWGGIAIGLLIACMIVTGLWLIIKFRK